MDALVPETDGIEGNMSILVVFLSGISAGAFSLGYRFVSLRGYAVPPVLLAFSIVTTVFPLTVMVTTGSAGPEPLTLLIGFISGISTLFAILLYFVVLETSKYAVSWTVIQFSVLVPFILGIAAFGERPSGQAIIGTGSILTALVLFGLGKRNERRVHGNPASAPGYRIAFLLTLSTVLSGVSQAGVQVYRELVPGGSIFPLMFASGLGMCTVSALWWALHLRGAGSAAVSRGVLLVAAYMGGLNILAFALLLIGLGALPGTVAFPIRNAVNIVSVFIFSFLLFRERSTRYELAGAGAAVAGIILVSSGT